MTLSAFLSSTNSLCLTNVKFDLRHMILEKTAVLRDHAPKLVVDRLKMADSKKSSAEREETDGDKQSRNSLSTEMVFNQAYEQLKDYDLALLRPHKPVGAEPHLSFQIVLRGEHVVGEGGPYRQFFADISKELQPLGSSADIKNIGLLVKTPNNSDGATLGKDKWTLAPCRNSSTDIAKYEFLGTLMGICIRTGAHMTLNLPQFIWK
jgi:other hect domain ubiquitin protein ligase E3